MVTAVENKRRLDVHYKTGYTQYIKFATVFNGSDYAGDLVNDTYLLINKAIANGGCQKGVSHGYIIRAIKLNFYDKQKLKRDYDNYNKIPDDILYFDDTVMNYHPEDEQDELQARILKELNFKLILTYVENHFNMVEQSIFKMRYISGFTNKEIMVLMNDNKYKYSETKISFIFKRINENLIAHFNPKN